MKKVTGSLKLNSIPIRAYILIDPAAGFKIKIQFNDDVQFEAGDTMEVDAKMDVKNPGNALQFEVSATNAISFIQVDKDKG